MSPNLRTALIFGGFISLVGAAFYPIYFRPLLLPEEYRECPVTPRGPGLGAPGSGRERASCKSSWNYSGRCAATRVKSVV
ncbi:small integral membrane protein 20 isoform X1 [Canis lupus baileyi]|uniref:small integral membrane protein 20 isoform X1 n=1 Tax=Canis lupus dingo TaxID=286419 RepID=UPI000DC670A6|nr:small integral membrane protein 20 isoform X1 [Canis lupus dingo]